MTTATFKYIDPSSYTPNSTIPFEKPWAKVDGPGWSFRMTERKRSVENLRGQEDKFGVDVSGFAVYKDVPSKVEKFSEFQDETKVREEYYAEIEKILKDRLAGVKKVAIFDHTIRKHDPSAPRQPVQQVHIDQTPAAAAARVRRHLPADEAEGLLKGRYQIINVWRPIEHPATDFPLAVVDWRTISSAEDLVPVDLLYPKRADTPNSLSDDDRGKEVLPDPTSYTSTAGYEIKGETYSVAPNPNHKFYYTKDMTPSEVLFIKCFDSRAEDVPVEFGKPTKGIARGTPHTAFVDPETPEGVKGRQSIEVRCLVFYEDE